MLKATMTNFSCLSSLTLLALLLGSSASASAENPLEQVSACHVIGDVLDLEVTAGRLHSPRLGYIDELVGQEPIRSHPRHAIGPKTEDLLLSIHFDSSASAILVEVSDGEQPWSHAMTLQPDSQNFGHVSLRVGQSYRLSIPRSPQAQDLSGPYAPPIRAAVLKPVKSCIE